MSRGKGQKNESGQASILIGMMMLTFILFFAFVVNTGMLVNAKINLQNAADAAAYAGAATQARLLNQISYLNYEMRRAYKKFLFRYYVVGNMAQRSHPSNSAGSTVGVRRWTPDGNPANDFQVPSVCVIFNRQDNFCQLTTLSSIRIPSQGNSLDGTQGVLIDQLERIERQRQSNCLDNSVINTQLLSYWLFNTDPDLKELERLAQNNAGGDPDVAQMAARMTVIRGLAFGLGLVPRLALHRARIKTLNEYINEPALSGVTAGQVDGLRNSPDPAMHERTIQAYLSAYQTLGSGIYPGDDIELTELLPGGGSAADLLRLTDITARFDAYAAQFDLRPGAPGATGTTVERDCLIKLVPFTFSNGFTVGVKKELDYLTYYAVRLTARAKVMFSPFGDMRMKAYAAAFPFGSRIGPALTEADWTLTRANNAMCGLFSIFGCVGRVPNLPVTAPNDANGWYSNNVVATFFDQFRAASGGGGTPGALPPALQPSDFERAYQAAMVPNPWEAGKYNIINDLTVDPFIRYFETPSRIYAFWAPIVSPAKANSSDAEQQIRDIINSVVDPKVFNANNPSAGLGAPNAQATAIKANLQAGLTNYFTLLRSGRGEEGEGFHVARLADPYRYRPVGTAGAGPPATIALTDSSVMLSDPNLVRSSWNDPKDGSFKDRGRAGYSVKFISFDTLMNNTGVYTDGQATVWNNIPVLDAEATDDLAGGLLQH